MMMESGALQGVVLAVLVAEQADSLVSKRVEQVQVGLEGFAGDKHAGFTRGADGRTPNYPRGALIRNERQVSIVSQEELRIVADRLGVAEVQPEWLGANLLLSGIPGLTELPPATRLRFSQGAVLVVQAENRPCAGPGRVLASQFARPELQRQFPWAALHRRGLVAVVEWPGWIRQGEGLVVSPQPGCPAHA